MNARVVFFAGDAIKNSPVSDDLPDFLVHPLLFPITSTSYFFSLLVCRLDCD